MEGAMEFLWSIGIWVALGALCLAGLGFLRRFLWHTLRAAILARRFGDESFVDAIMEGEIEQGMTREMVIAAWGQPADEDERVLKTKSKLEMKYDHRGGNRYGTRVYLENGEVVGWDRK